MLRELTLNEKITLKGILSRKYQGYSFPRLHTRQALELFYQAYGCSIGNYGKYITAPKWSTK